MSMKKISKYDVENFTERILDVFESYLAEIYPDTVLSGSDYGYLQGQLEDVLYDFDMIEEF